MLGSKHSTHLDRSPLLDCGMLGYKEFDLSHFLARGQVLERVGFCWTHKFFVTPSVRAGRSRVQAMCSAFCILVGVLRGAARMHSKHCSMSTGLGRDATAEREIGLALYKVEGKLNTSVWASRVSWVWGVSGSLPSGVHTVPQNFLSLTYLILLFVISLFLTLFFRKTVIQESHHER